MSSLGWLDVSTININALLLLEPLHLQYLASRKPDQAMGTILQAHPAIQWYFKQIFPEIDGYVKECLALGVPNPTPEELRHAELEVLDSMQDWLIYVLNPALYDQLKFLSWDDQSLLSMANFEDKIVLDIGSGTGRLAFTVAPYAQVVFAIEPIPNLRRYLWQKRTILGLTNVYPIDGTITQIPLPADFADILMAGHVFGDDFDQEYAEMRRVVKNGGMILLHPGSNANSEDPAHEFLIGKGFAFDIFEEPGDGLKRKYWLTVHK